MINGADQPVRVHLGAIFIAFPTGLEADQEQTVALATKARKRVVSGESFASVSADVDQGPYGANGGTMGTFSDGELVGELNVAAFSTEVGEVSEPVVTGQGVFLLEVRQREKIPVRPYEEIRDQIASKVFEGRIEREKDAWYQQARREAAVVIKLKDPKAK
jgi:parvulin-like peptidyl-prolyl isomerase